MSENTLLSNYQAAVYLGVSPGQLKLSRYNGELFKGVPSPHFLKIGKAIRYCKSDLEKWVEKHPRFISNAEALKNKGVLCNEK